jgi:hypothetical protein
MCIGYAANLEIEFIKTIFIYHKLKIIPPLSTNVSSLLTFICHFNHSSYSNYF